MTAAAALVVAGKVNDLKAGVATARQSVTSGSARQTLQKLVVVSNG
jgi:anthranilate phosphoribosyltransferase